MLNVTQSESSEWQDQDPKLVFPMPKLMLFPVYHMISRMLKLREVLSGAILSEFESTL